MTSTLEGTTSNDSRPLWRLLFGIIDRPAETFRAVLARRQWTMWLAPLLVLGAAFAVFSVVNLPHAQELARQQAERQLASLPAEQAATARATLDTTLSTPVMLATTLGFGSAALLIGLLAQATFLYFSALIAGGDDMNFGAVFTMSSWTKLPQAINFLVQTGFVAFSGAAINYPGLSALVGSGDLMTDARNPFFVLLAQIDLFWLWHLLLVVVGLAVVARLSRVKSLVLTLIYAALALGLTVLPTVLFSGMMGG
ncbi:MAG: YIP1 family protein [Chloroflexota bacterium]